MLTRKCFLSFGLSAASLLIASGCGNNSVSSDSSTDNTANGNTDTDEYSYVVSYLSHQYTLPDYPFRERGSAAYYPKDTDPNVYIHLGYCDCTYSDAEYFAELYSATPTDFTVSDAFEHFSEYITGCTADEDYYFDRAERHDTLVNSSEVVKVGNWDMEHVSGTFSCENCDVRFVAYVVVCDDEVCWCMASDVAAAQSIDSVFLANGENLESPSDELLEEWARKIAETFSEKE